MTAALHTAAPQPWGTRLRRQAFWAMLGLFMVASVAVVVPAAVADLGTMQARWQVGRWMSGAARPPAPQQWAEARQALINGLAYTPADANLLELLGWLHASRGVALYPSLPDLAQDYLRQAQTYYTAAAKLRPMSAVAWGNVALAAHYLRPLQPEILWPAFDKALAWGHREGAAQRSVAEIGLARWAELSPERQEALKTMLQQAQPRNRPALQAIARRYGLGRLAEAPADK